MITSNATQNVERSGVGEESQFKIRASAKAFKILSDGLYSDKISSIIRELSCNAYDSHIQAKNSNPFHVHLPNQLEPHFAIRDFGIGLTHDDVMSIFTTYFESTKTASNDYVGCLGLGSKSPFSYTDNFTVTSWHNGTKNIYNCFINEQEIPSVALLSSTHTTEPNGLEVLFAVKSNDYREFSSKAAVVYRYFKLQPKITGQQIDRRAPVYKFNSNNWGILEGYGSANAIMGNVVYPLNDVDQNGYTSAEMSLLRLPVNLYFDIGELEVSASREKLSYNARTKGIIKTKLTAAVEEISKEIQLKIETCDTLWEARQLLFELHSGEFRELMKIVDQNKLTWKGTLVNDYITGLLATSIYFTDLDSKVEVTEVDCRDYKDRLNFNTIQTFYISDHQYLFIKDTNKHMKLRLKEFMVKEFSKLKANGWHGNRLKIYLIADKIAGGVKEFKTKMGMGDKMVFPLLSSLPYTLPVSGAGSVNPKNSANVFRYDATIKNGDASDWWLKEKIDKSLGGVYVVIDRYLINGVRPLNYMIKYQELFNSLNIVMPEVYGVKQREADAFATLKNWQTLKDYTVKSVEKFVIDSKLGESLKSCVYLDAIDDCCNGEFETRIILESVVEHGIQMFTTSSILDIIQKINEAKKVKETFDKIKIVSHMTGYDFSNLLTQDEAFKKEVTQEIKTVATYVTKNYPLLASFRSYNLNDTTVKHMKHYIGLVDASLMVAKNNCT